MITESSAQKHRTIFPAALIAAVVSFAFVGIADAQSQKFQVGVIGDTSYSKVAEQEFDRLMGALNKENLAFVVHVGDFEARAVYDRAGDHSRKQGQLIGGLTNGLRLRLRARLSLRR